MTQAEDAKQNERIVKLETQMAQTIIRLNDNFEQHKTDFYPIQKKIYIAMGVITGLNIALTLYKTFGG